MVEELKTNIFFDEDGMDFEEMVMEMFEERVVEIIKKYQDNTFPNK